MFSLYIFDMGGVVANSNAGTEPRLLPSCNDEMAAIFKIGGDDFDALTIGAIDSSEFLRRFAAKTGGEIEKDLLTRCFHPEPDRDVLGLIDTLKKHARVVVGTNTITPHYDIHIRNGDYNAFDEVYASHLIGLAKPDPAFYLHIIEREDRTPEETVFIDDTEVNVEAARRIGIHAFVFKDARQLMRDLAVPE